MNEKKIATCDQSVIDGLRFLEEEIEETGIRGIRSAPVFFLLDKFGYDNIEPYVENWADNSPNEWEIQYEKPHCLYYISELEKKYRNEYSEELLSMRDYIKSNQTIDGEINTNTYSTAGPLRFLISVEPESSAVQRGIDYFLSNKLVFNHENKMEVAKLGYAALSIAELDYYKYEKDIESILDQVINGYELAWLKSEVDISHQSLYPLIGLARLSKETPDLIDRSVEALEAQQQDQGYWTTFSDLEDGEPGPPVDAVQRTGNVLLFLTSAGKGAKVSEDEIRWERKLTSQQTRRSKPNLVTTRPSTRLDKSRQEILQKYQYAINKSEKILRISTLRIDMLHEDIINKLQESDEFEIRLITSTGTSGGDRKKMKKAVMNELVERTNGGVKEDQLIHTRMIIADQSDAIISSADLTRDQLYDEFNAGVHIEDPDVVEEVIELFDEMWEESEYRNVTH